MADTGDKKNGLRQLLVLHVNNGWKRIVTGKSLKQVQRKFGLNYLVQQLINN